MFCAIAMPHLRYQLLPSARLLYQWIGCHHRPDKSVEIDLEQFQLDSLNMKRGGYCLVQIVKAFRQLVGAELITVEREYNRTVYRAQWHHPSDFNFPNRKKNVSSASKVSENAPQTRIPSYSIKDIKDTSNTDAVAEESLEEEEELTPEEKTKLKDFEEEASQVGIVTNENVRKIVKNFSWNQISSAISLIKEKLQGFKPVKNRTGFFLEALKNGWVSENAPPPKPELPQEWEPWISEFGDLIEPGYSVNTFGLVRYVSKHPNPSYYPKPFTFPIDNEQFLDWIAI